MAFPSVNIDMSAEAAFSSPSSAASDRACETRRKSGLALLVLLSAIVSSCTVGSSTWTAISKRQCASIVLHRHCIERTFVESLPLAWGAGEALRAPDTSIDMDLSKRSRHTSSSQRRLSSSAPSPRPSLRRVHRADDRRRCMVDSSAVRAGVVQRSERLMSRLSSCACCSATRLSRRAFSSASKALCAF